MKEIKLKKLLAIALTAMAISTISPIGASAAWKQDSNGWWNTEGTSYSIGWRNIDNTWYYFNSNGYMKTGWVNDGGKWYFMQPSGSMQTGWLFDNGTWYYLNTSGAMQTGFVQVNNKTYYLLESGAMKTGTVTIGDITYIFDKNGEQVYKTDLKLPVANSTTNNSTTTNSDDTDVDDTDTKTTDKKSAYKSLYGTWTVTDYITSSSTKLTQDQIQACLGEQFTISKDSLTAYGFTVPNPKVNVSTVSASDFRKKWNIDVDDTKITSVKISYSVYSADIYIVGDNTYSVLKGSLFKIKK